MPNRLSLEKSPYLLQHAGNPVEWYPWGPEAFQKARAENKPVILSIGYSTCHWCHVMERESFEDERTAALMNESYVSIKVDREERPDIDGIYMNYVMATTGSGGWPMTVFLTPDQKPFYGGTYFPPEDRYGMPGFKTLLASIADAWKTRRDEITRSADSAAQFLNAPPQTGQSLGGWSAALTPEPLDEAYRHFESSFDAENGGFGGAPKFPRSHALSFLLRYWKRAGSEKALAMATRTLDAMARGGIYDQLGGGFHRYSTDRKWRIPHFEKMLYDQALLVTTYLEAFQAVRDPEYARVARETLDYVLREMTAPDGGFYSAEDADSPATKALAGRPDEMREGAFFLWEKEEIEKILGPDAAVFITHYGVEAGGNALADPHHEFQNKNALHVARPDAGEKSLETSRRKLFEARSARPRPHRDDKVLTDWNGLMIAALARASRVLGEPRYAEAAVRAAGFVAARLRTPEGRLLHRFRDNDAAIEGTLNDYAFFVEALAELYQADFDEKWLSLAVDLAGRMTDLFADVPRGGFYLTARDAEALITRPKEVYDGAVPSGNSAAALALLKLGRLTGREELEGEGRRILEAVRESLAASPANYTQMLAALDMALGPSSEVVVAGRRGDAVVEQFLQVLARRFEPNRVVMLNPDGKGSFPWKDKGPVGGRAAAYVCRNHACQAPVTDPKKLEGSQD